jgi:hypothetical protein
MVNRTSVPTAQKIRKDVNSRPRSDASDIGAPAAIILSTKFVPFLASC